MPKKKTVFTPNKYKKCLDDAHSSPDNNSEISSLDNPVKDLILLVGSNPHLVMMNL